MADVKKVAIFSEELISSKIFIIRGRKTMLDFDLAALYEIETKSLKRSVRRNIVRFPDDFMFELTKQEFEDLRYQFGTSRWGGARYTPMVFTEQGVAMLSGIINTERAIKVNIQIMRVLSKLRSLLESHKELLEKLDKLELKDIEHDEQIKIIFEYLRKLKESKEQDLEYRNRERIGYKQGSSAN